MNHYVLTTSAYRDYPADANARRVALTRGVTARSLAAQDMPWTWLVYVDERDPLLSDRMAAFRSAGAPVVPVRDPAEAIDWSEDILTTRLDDDDAFAVDAFHRLRGAVSPLARTVYVFTTGYRVCGGRSVLMDHRTNQWASLYAPAGDRTHVRAVQHRHLGEIAPLRVVDERPAFLWVRHQDTRSAYRSGRDLIPSSVRRAFDIDWSLV